VPTARWLLPCRDPASQRKLEAEASGRRLTGPERARWLAAKSEFEECERLWDQMYRAGVVIVVGGDDEQHDDPGFD
jgi:pentatricopeptide repeat protein